MTVKRERVTDGIFEWDKLTFSMTDVHPSDSTALTQMLLNLAPEPRLQNLEAFADNADLTDPLVALRIKQLRKQIAYARRMAVDGCYEPALIDLADSTRLEILSLPLKLAGLKSKHGHCSRDDHADKLAVIELVRNTPNPPTTLTTWLQLPEIARYAKKYKGSHTLRDWINEALPGHLKRGRPKKT